MPRTHMEQTKKKFLKNMIGFSMMTWITFLIGFVASPIATRLFTPDEKGKLDMFIGVYASLISSLCYLGLDQAFVRFFVDAPGKMNRKGLFTFCTVVPLTFSVLSSFALLFFWRGMTVEIIGRESLPIFICLCIYSFCLVLFRFLSLCYRMEQNAKLYTIQGVCHALITKVAYLAVGFKNPTGEAAILSLTLLTALFSLTFLFIQRKRFDKTFLAQVDKSSVRELSFYALPLLPITVLSWLNSSISSVVLKNLLGFSALGIYTSALGLANTINIIQTGFNTYWAPYVLENYRSDDKKRFYTVHRLMACLLTFFGLAATLLQSPIFLLLGKSYRSSVIFFPFLFLSPICYCLGETTGMGITISKKSYWTTLIFIISAALNIGLCYLFIPLLGMSGAALATAFSAILTLLLRTGIGERYYRAIGSYRYLAYTIGLMLTASFVNLLVEGALKYVLLLAVLALAVVLFRSELKTLFETLGQLVSSLRRKKPAPKEDDHEQ